MTAVNTCPDPARLREHLDGTLPEGAEVELITHLDHCAGCQRELENLAASDGPLLAVARQVGREPPVSGPAFQDVLIRLGEQLTGDQSDRAGDDHALLAGFGLIGAPGCLGAYEVRDVLGRGGMGVVFRAFDPALRRIVALKVLAPQLAASTTARERFVREARAAAAVRHDHVIDIHAVEEAGGLPYLVMEYVAGGSLQDRLDRDGPLPLAEVVRIGAQTAAGLAAAHAAGLVHRDVKPANILLDESTGRVKLTDFGLARAADEAGLTQTGVVPGTPSYMAPEQARGSAVDCRADLFSLGSVLYALCAGRPPFRGEGPLVVLRRVADEAPRPLREVNPAVPEWLAQIIARLHEQDPARRFASAAEVADLLARHVANLGGTTPLPPSRPRRPSRPSRWWRHLRMAGAAAVLLAAVGFGLAEAGGVTHLAATLIRFCTPDGTLVVRVDDPDVSVVLDGQGDLVIHGAGTHEVRLRPGSYRYRATLDGDLVQTDLVTIARGDRQVVTVRVEPPAGFREIRRLEGHVHNVMDLAFSGDGRRAVTGSWDKTVPCWDLDTGRELRCFSPRDGVDHGIYCVALSPDGRRALAGSRAGSFWFWDVETGKELGRCQLPVFNTAGATAVDFFPDGGRALVANHQGSVCIFDTARWQEVQRLEHGPGLWGARVSPDGRQVVTSGGNDGAAVLRLWELSTGTEVRRFEGHTSGCWRAVFSPDGKSILSGSEDQTMRLWETDTGKELRCFHGHTAGVTAVAFTPDGRRALSASYDQTVRLWDVQTGTELHRFVDRAGQTMVASSPRGRLALSGSFDGTLRLWRLPP